MLVVGVGVAVVGDAEAGGDADNADNAALCCYWYYASWDSICSDPNVAAVVRLHSPVGSKRFDDSRPWSRTRQHQKVSDGGPERECHAEPFHVFDYSCRDVVVDGDDDDDDYGRTMFDGQPCLCSSSCCPDQPLCRRLGVFAEVVYSA